MLWENSAVAAGVVVSHSWCFMLSGSKWQMAPNENVLLRINWGWSQTLWVNKKVWVPVVKFVLEIWKRINARAFFPVCRSVWGAIWGWLLKKELSNKTGSPNIWDFWFIFPTGDFGCVRRDCFRSYKDLGLETLLLIENWTYCQGPN